MIEPIGMPGAGITHKEVLLRARADLYRELNALRMQAEEEELPESLYDEDRQALLDKIGAVNGMLYYECGEYC